MPFFDSSFSGVLGIVHLVLFVWALVQILSSSMSPGMKVLWAIIVLALPVVGLILYLLLGRKV